jgi:putative transposase
METAMSSPSTSDVSVLSHPRRNIVVQRRYLFRLYPDPAQSAALHQQRMMMVDLWNALLQRHEDIYGRTRGRQRGVTHAEGKSSYTFFDMTAEITGLRRECAEWAALSVWSAHGIAHALDQAFQGFFRRAKQGAGAQSGYPRFQRRRHGQRIPHRHNLPPGRKSGSGSGCRLAERDGRNWSLALKGIGGPIHARGKLPAQAIAYKNADVLWRDDKWWLSICVEMAPRRNPGDRKIMVDFDLIDGFARIDGEIETPAKLARAHAMMEHVDSLKSERDRRWPRRASNDPEWQESNREIARLSARVARLRRECLHVWTTRVVRRANDITIRMPRVSAHIATPRGDAGQWGAAVETVSSLNRNTLSYAPAAAAAMLQYKAEEAGIRCDVIVDEAPGIAVGKKLVAAGRAVRRAKWAIRRDG